MNQKQISIVKQQLTIKNNRPVTSSVNVAAAFGKEHFHVLRDIEALDCSQEFSLSNFGWTVTERPNPSGGAPIKSRAVELTKDGFIFLAMGYRGQVAARLKEVYIAAFNQMEEELRARKVQGLDAMVALVSSASEKGHAGNFLPDLIRLRRGGLSCEEIGKVTGHSTSVVSFWLRKLGKIGVALPARRRNLTMNRDHFSGQGQQLFLPWGQA